MTSFYQPHVREPVFLALTRFGLWAVDGQDVGVSVASMIGSVAAIFATFLLGAAVASPIVGFLAAAVMAIEMEAVTWAVDGWRDDTFTAMFLFAAWALVRLLQRPSFANAVLAGLVCGLPGGPPRACPACGDGVRADGRGRRAVSPELRDRHR
jgi:4-amino-4-deoxy-L-arabinose transferase-like glycosyltransferase